MSKNVPDISDYLTFNVRVQPPLILITIDFNHFYMNEFDAPEAESVYRMESGKKNAYAVVHVGNGQAVLRDLMIEGTPFREYLKKRRDNKMKEGR